MNENGIIVMHDALPHRIEYTSMLWCGTSYKSIMRASQTSGLKVRTWENDHGCAIIVKDQTVIIEKPITTEFEDLWKNNGAVVGKSTTDEIINYIKSLASLQDAG